MKPQANALGLWNIAWHTTFSISVRNIIIQWFHIVVVWVDLYCKSIFAWRQIIDSWIDLYIDRLWSMSGLFCTLIKLCAHAHIDAWLDPYESSLINPSVDKYIDEYHTAIINNCFDCTVKLGWLMCIHGPWPYAQPEKNLKLIHRVSCLPTMCLSEFGYCGRVYCDKYISSCSSFYPCRSP